MIADELGMKLENVTLDDLGRAGNVIATQDTTTIIAGAGNKAEIESRAAELKNLVENTDSKYDREKLIERIAKLAG